ncbi:MAG: hypothetical protein Q9163_006068 [Psora crenata]
MYTIFPAAQEVPIFVRSRYLLSVSKATYVVNSYEARWRRNVQQSISQRALHQRTVLQDDSPADDIKHPADPWLRRANDGPIIRYQPVGTVTSAQRRARIDSLGVDVLGTPAKVLVLEQHQKEPYRRPILAEGPDTNPRDRVLMSPSDLLHAVGKERGIVSADQICENIEALRQSILNKNGETVDTVSEDTYDEMVIKLRGGFEARQLQVYIERAQRSLAPNPIDLGHDYSCDIYARSSWRAGETPISLGRAPEILKYRNGGSVNASMPASTLRKRMKKDDLINIIMLECWQMTGPQRGGSGQGEVDIRLLPTHFDVIFHHRNDMLRKVSESYGVKLEASRPERIIRISSDFEACGDVFRLLKYMIENIQHASVDLMILDSAAKKDLFARTERLTSTVIKESEESEFQRTSLTRVDIYYLGPDTSDFDDAIRILNSAAKPNVIQERNLLWAYAPTTDAIASSPTDVSTSLPIEDRNIKWSRWYTPTIAGSDMAELSEETLGDHIAKRKRRALHKVRLVLADNTKQEKEQDANKMPSSIARHWAPKLVPDMFATLGQLVFPTTMAEAAEQALLKDQASQSGNANFEETVAGTRRELLTMIPGMVGALRKLPSASRNIECFLITFSPMPPPDLPPQLAKALPNLELRIKFSDDERKATLETARLIVEEKVLDIVLPADIIDLRISKRISAYAKAFDPALHHFVSSSSLAAWSDERLSTPNSLSLTIPGHAIRWVENGDSSVYIEGLRVEYTLTDMEHQSMITTTLSPDAEINYTIIGAGRTGGRREELSVALQKGILQKHLADGRWDHVGSLWNATDKLINKIKEGNF